MNIGDLFQYTEAKFTYAKVIAEAVLSHLNSMSGQNRQM